MKQKKNVDVRNYNILSFSSLGKTQQLPYNFPSRSQNLVDNMINRLETYANNLEDIVADRTKQLEDEKQKTDTLLYRMLPRSATLVSILHATEIGTDQSACARLIMPVNVWDLGKFNNLNN